MRKLGLLLLYSGFVWIAFLQFNLFMRAGLRPVVLAQYAKLPSDLSHRYTQDEAHAHIRETAEAVYSHAPFVLAPGIVMLAGGLLVAFGSRRRLSQNAA
jgi:uncharacterized membrane protein YedE/YeeE